VWAPPEGTKRLRNLAETVPHTVQWTACDQRLVQVEENRVRHHVFLRLAVEPTTSKQLKAGPELLPEAGAGGSQVQHLVRRESWHGLQDSFLLLTGSCTDN
jgi:hypothetical protein